MFGILWILTVVAGMWAMLVYQDTPAPASQPSFQWPQNSGLKHDTERATLVMLAHPKCPCTRASIGELNSIMVEGKDKLTVYVLFYKPKGSAETWATTDLWQSAAAIPGVRVLSDEDGREAKAFRAAASGQTMLFNSKGHLVFKGGITAGRGHAGDNAGRSAIVAYLRTGHAERDTTAVFGCSITGESRVVKAESQN